jgi:hypothetical protein
MIGIAIANSLGLSAAAAGPDPSASAYFTATGITGSTEQQAIDNLVKGLKADGIWSKMKAVYPFVTDNRNLLSFTEDFGNAFWTLNASSVTANVTTAPNGTITADRLTENSANNYHTIYVNNYAFVNGFGSFSIYVKFNGRKYIALGANSSTLFNAAAFFDISAGSVVSTSFGTASIENAGNGWYRCTISGTTTNGTTPLSLTLLDDSLNALYTGNGTSGIFLWGAQYELTSTATTYQPIATTQQAFISSQFKYNLVNPVDSDAAFRLVFNGGWTHSNNGAQGNGVNSFANPFLSSSANLQLNSAHVSYYSRTNSAANMVMMGTQSLYVLARWTQYHANNSVESDQGGISTGNTTAGFFMSNRTNGTAMKYQINGTIQTDSTSTAALATLQENPSLYLGCQNTLLYGVRLHNNYQTAFASIGDGLTDTEAANLYTRVQAFQTSLSRQV